MYWQAIVAHNLIGPPPTRRGCRICVTVRLPAPPRGETKYWQASANTPPSVTPPPSNVPYQSDGFFRPSFLVTDFSVAREHGSDVHLGVFGSQSHNGTDHWVKLAVKTAASCPSSDTRNTSKTALIKASLLKHDLPVHRGPWKRRIMPKKNSTRKKARKFQKAGVGGSGVVALRFKPRDWGLFVQDSFHVELRNGLQFLTFFCLVCNPHSC